VRGAPQIGVAAAYGLAVEANRLPDERLRAGLRRAAATLGSARPTAVNLGYAVKRVVRLLDEPDLVAAGLRRLIQDEARAIEREEAASSLATARHGAKLVPPGATILTICNTGALAGPGMGSALGVVFQAHLDGKKPRVYACETRPLLQGSRLTTLELMRARIPVTLIADSAAASVIEKCDIVLVGADRIARNGDTANKVGTKMLAVVAHAAGKPFYVVAPSTSFDLSCADGGDIAIEERGGEEVRGFAGCRAAPAGVPAFNPAFDVTPARLITAFITERGIIRPPFRRSIGAALRR
jgi:methylthioribose-1-phosphate isomerase